MAKSENDDLRINLKINKESLQSLIQQQAPQEVALIKTINVISSENIRLQMQVERLKQENNEIKMMMTGRSFIRQESPTKLLKVAAVSDLDSQSRKETNAKSTSKRMESRSSNEAINQLFGKTHSSKSTQNFCQRCQKLIDEKQKDPRELSPFQREEAFKENERTIKKLMMDVQKYQNFLKSLLENYSLPENLMEDVREIVYDEELTHYDNNNEFFAQMPLSPISTSSFSSIHNYSKHGNKFLKFDQTPQQVLQVSKPSQLQQQQNKQIPLQVNIPKLDFSKLKFEDELNYYQEESLKFNNHQPVNNQQYNQPKQSNINNYNYPYSQNPNFQNQPKHKFISQNAMALFESAENLKTENQLQESNIELNDSNLLDDQDLCDFQHKLGNRILEDLNTGRPSQKQGFIPESCYSSIKGNQHQGDFQNKNQQLIDNDLQFLDDDQYDSEFQYMSQQNQTENGFTNNQQMLLGMTNTIDLEGSREYRKDDIQQQSSFMSNVNDLGLNQ